MFKIRQTDFVNNCAIDFGDLTLSMSNGRFPHCNNVAPGISDNVEVAILKGDKFVTKTVWMQVFGDEIFDDVVGWVDAKTVAQLIAALAKGIK